MPAQPIPPQIDRQAVVLIHGIGEQRPMDTLRGFVQAIVPPIPNSTTPLFFSKPDRLSDSLELRRLTTNEQRASFKTDYYEFYWANLMEAPQVADVWSWIRSLFIRQPGSLPKRLRWIYYTFWGTLVAILVILGFTMNVVVDIWKGLSDKGGVKIIVGFVASGVLAYINNRLTTYLGDAVRYMTPRAANINQRQKIRQAGLQLLRQLHETDANGNNRYDRVVVVGHSLGSVIAYDLLNLFWCERCDTLPKLPVDALDTAEQQALALNESRISQAQYRQAQFDLWSTQAEKPGSWRIADFVTIGSPLAFADLYLADASWSLNDKIEQREFPTCPPALEINKKGEKFFSFPTERTAAPRTMHHAALFALTRWTNLSFTSDYVGGPINGFGPGVENHTLTAQSTRLPFRSHSRYWENHEPESLSLLRERLELRFPKHPGATTHTQHPASSSTQP